MHRFIAIAIIAIAFTLASCQTGPSPTEVALSQELEETRARLEAESEFASALAEDYYSMSTSRDVSTIELEVQKAKVAAAIARNTALSSELETRKAEIIRLEARIDALGAAIEDAKANGAALEAKIAALAADRAALSDDLAKTERLLSESLAGGSQTEKELGIALGNYQAAAARAKTAEAMLAETTLKLDATLASLDKATANVAALEVEKAELMAKVSKLSEDVESLLQGIYEKSEAYGTLLKERDSLRTRSLSLEERIAQLEERLAEALHASQNATRRAAELSASLELLSSTSAANKELLQAAVERLSREKDELLGLLGASEVEVDILKRRLAEDERRLAETMAQLKKDLEVQISRGELDVIQYNNIIVVHIKDSLLFKPDSDKIEPGNEKILQTIVQAFDKYPNKMIRVEGHTAAASTAWSSRWLLGAARAVSVVRFFQENLGVDPQRLVAVSFGEYSPIAPNDTEANRRKNRRVEIALVDRPLYQIRSLVGSER
jgi:chemotaxis protein MotB